MEGRYIHGKVNSEKTRGVCADEYIDEKHVYEYIFVCLGRTEVNGLHGFAHEKLNQLIENARVREREREREREN